MNVKKYFVTAAAHAAHAKAKFPNALIIITLNHSTINSYSG